jgi:hypothetical protein
VRTLRSAADPTPVIPAQAGIQKACLGLWKFLWIPAYAGMTVPPTPHPPGNTPQSGTASIRGPSAYRCSPGYTT